MKAYVITEAKVLWVPMGTGKIDPETGEEKKRFIKTGIKITFDDGTWWFHHFRYKSWTRHRLGPVLYYRSGTPITDPQGNVQRDKERVDRFENERKLMEQLGHCKPLIDALHEGFMQAIAEDAAKSAA